MTTIQQGTNPFASRSVPQELMQELGVKTDIPNTLEEENKRLEGLIPAAGDATTEEGFQKMLSILGKQAPKMPDINTAPEQVSTTEPMQLREQAVAPTQSIKKEETDVAKDAKSNDNKEQTLSEQMGLHYEDEEILPILDSLMTKGYASETINLRNNLITFRVTYSWEEQEIIKRLDKQITNGDVNLRQTGSYFYDLYCLAASLERFGANYFKPVPMGSDTDLKTSFDERIKFLSGLASPFITILVQKRVEFVKKIQYLTDNINKYLQVF